MFRIGVDLGGTGVKAGVVRVEGGAYEIIGKAALPTGNRPPAETVEIIAEAARSACKGARINMNDAASVGIGTPGAVNPKTGTVLFAANLSMKNFPLGAELSTRLGVSVAMANDANAAALGEVVAGGAKGARNAVVLTLGTGLGGGIIIDGELYAGANFYGGEIGHMVIRYGGEACTCGRKGCFEAYASATALIRDTQKAMNADPHSQMWRISGGHADAMTAFEAKRKGDGTAAAVVSAYIEYLACGIANIVNIFQPEIVLLGGGISGEGDEILTPLREIVARESFGGVTCELGVCLLGNDAGIIGAACLDNRRESE